MSSDRWFAIFFLCIGVFVIGYCVWLGLPFFPDGNVQTAFWGGLVGGNLFGIGGLLWQRRHPIKRCDPQ